MKDSSGGGAVRRQLIALAGPPGSGKSTLAPQLAALLGAVVVPMDGYHLDNRLLDPAGLRPRKGAPQTFDVAGLTHALPPRKGGEAEVILPAFDRARDVAIAGAIRVGPNDKLLLVEGNYLLSPLPGWSELASLWDAALMLEVPQPVLQARLTARWQGLGLPPEQVAAHLHNDLANAGTVTASPPPETVLRIGVDHAADPAAVAARVATLLG